MAGRATLTLADDDAEVPVGRPRPLQHLIAFMEEHAAEPLTIAEMAAAVHLTPRAVQFMFRRHFDCTPTGYLRRIRMHRVDHDLRAADPAFDTVTKIASRWGFAHPGRFAREYKQVYGRSPSETLRMPPAETTDAPLAAS